MEYLIYVNKKNKKKKDPKNFEFKIHWINKFNYILNTKCK